MDRHRSNIYDRKKVPKETSEATRGAFVRTRLTNCLKLFIIMMKMMIIVMIFVIVNKNFI